MNSNNKFMVICATIVAIVFITFTVTEIWTSNKSYVQDETLNETMQQLQYLDKKLDELGQQIDELERSIQEFLDRWNVAVFSATAYSPRDDRNGLNSEGNPNVTALGYTSGPGVFAVDFNVIPPHSRLWIEGEGWGIAGDTGGAIVGARVDIYRRSFEEAMSFGRRNVVVVYERKDTS